MALKQALEHAIQLQRGGRVGEAELAYRAILNADPHQVDALHFLGLLRYRAGFPDEGLKLVQQAVELSPDYSDAQSNLGNLLRAEGRLAQAVGAYQEAIRSNPNHPQAYNNLGVVLKDLGRLEEAAAAFRRCFRIAPKSGDPHLNLGNVLTLLGRHTEALAEYRRAVELEPGLLQGVAALSSSLRRQGRESEALQLWQDLSRKLPHHPVVKHMLAAGVDQDVPAQASESYVRTVFDGFADTFDHVLKELEYRAPGLVIGAVAARWPVAEGQLEVLDAGCGTGLCAELLRPYARRLVGVDLSAGMLAKARQRGLYDQLFEAELTRFLQERPAAYDLIASADTLVYFGDLAPVLDAAGKALRPGGLLAFSLEALDPAAKANYRLHPHGRYSHAETYVRSVLANSGFGPCTVSHEMLRKEAGQPVSGLLVAAHRQ